MGAWSHEPFGNDTANDWAYGLQNIPDLSLIEETIDRALEDGAEYLDASVAEEAIAAVEALAQVLGRGTQSDTYTEKVKQWAARVQAKPNPALRNKARQFLQRVVSEKSELHELWAESDELDVWLTSIQRMRAAIEA